MLSFSLRHKLADTLGLFMIGFLCFLSYPDHLYAQSFHKIEFVIGTGGDDLRGESSATATLLDAKAR